MKTPALALVALLAAPAAFAQTPLKLQAADGVGIDAALWPAEGRAKGVILLFHMAGSNWGEYSAIAPRLARNGYTALAIDQRSGGDGFGRRNETVRALGRGAGYQQALPDLEAALAHARKTYPGAPVAAWGSSYSASLVFLLAAKHPGELAAVLAFSPGEYFGGSAVAAAAAKVAAPVFVTSASDGGEIAEAKAILAAAPAAVKVQYVPERGVHGSSTLNSAGAAKNWAAVEAFLAKALP